MRPSHEAAFDWFEAFVRQLSYKPGYSFSLQRAQNWSAALSLRAELADADGYRESLPVVSIMQVDLDIVYEREDVACVVVSKVVRQFELHEADERLRWNGARLRQPHLQEDDP